MAKTMWVLALAAGSVMADGNPFNQPAGGNPFDSPAGGNANRAAAPFAGTFKDDKLTLALEADPAASGAYRGTVTSNGNPYPVTAEGRDGKLSGQFKVGEQAFPFSGTLENGVLTFTTGATTYKLASQAAAPAVPAPGPVVVPGPPVAVPAPPVPAPPVAQGTGIFGLGPAQPAGGQPGGVGMMIRLMEDNTIKVMGVKPDGPAAKAGVREGDQLLAIDGKDARGFKDPTELIKGVAGTEVTLTIDRAGQRSEIKITREPMQIPPNRIAEVNGGAAGGGGAIPAPAAEDRKAGVGVDIDVNDRGAFITGVHPGGPAERAGIRAGDQIIGINGQPLRNVEQLSSGLPGAVGSAIQLTMRRGAQTGNFDLQRAVTRAAAAGGDAPAPVAPVAPDADRKAGVGININVSDRGVIIQETVPDGPAARAGIRAGDQLVAIDGKPLRGVEDLTAGLPGAAGTPVRLTVRRAGQLIEVDMKREVTSR